MLTNLNIELIYDDDNKKIEVLIIGEIDYSNYEKLRQITRKILDSANNYKEIIFNLKDCKMISSNGFGLFFELQDFLINRKYAAKIKFSNVNNLILQNMKILKMDSEFEILV
ncbi:MAG TPA: STAS domain-containing protein [bacterium]|nr:STAS domain-containing protein [bacterium]HPP87703.1 STAS domain-containing protein [bacterium]